MPEVTLTKELGGHALGDSINVTEGVAAYLTNTGAAERAEQPTKRAPKRGAKAADEPGGGASPDDLPSTAG